MTPDSGSRTRTVIVTGATAGIGRAIAARFATAGARVGLIARDSSALDEFARAMRASGAEVAVESVDVADASAVFAAAQRLESKLGPVDVWINNAMVTVYSLIAQMTPEEFRRVTEVTYLGYVHGTLAALRSMRQRDSGRVIQIGSALAYRGIPLQSAYCAAKHAIAGFTDALRCELRYERSSITVGTVHLPAVNTPQFDWSRARASNGLRPMGRPVQPEAIADAVFRAAAGAGREYWVGSSTLLTILGNAALPSFLDWYLAKKAVAGQQTLTPADPRRPDNLFEPVSGLHRIRGSFSSEADGKAVVFNGESARVGAIIVLGLLAFASGIAIGQWRSKH